MTRKISVSLPDDVAERLDGKANVSAYVTDALEAQYSREQTERLNLSTGVTATDEERGQARRRARDVLARARAQCSPELFEQMRQRHGFAPLAQQNTTFTRNG